jgi:stage III sporulation protein AF
MKNLIAYMLLAALAVNMVPGKNYQRYISLAGGLIMIILLVSPLLSLFGQDENQIIQIVENYMTSDEGTDYSLADILAAPAEAEDILSDMQDYEDVGNEELARRELESIGVTLKDLEITKDKDGNVLRIIAIVEKYEDGQLMEIKEYIADIYNLDIDCIYVTRA